MSSNRSWICTKYGGTSVASLETWSTGILARTRVLLASGHRVWIVVSALSKVTNKLLEALDEATAKAGTPHSTLSSSSSSSSNSSFDWISSAHAKLASDMKLTAEEYAPASSMLDELKRLLDGISLTGEVSPKLRARVAAYGELLSSTLGAAYLRRQGLSCTRVDSRSLLTSHVDDSKASAEADTYLEADVRPSVQVERADAASLGADVVICQGFIASTPSGATCLLGRGGSDTSGALFAALCGAERCEIWTDVNGLFTADPRFVPKARLIRRVTYREAQELAAMGAKVLHPRCLLPAAFAGVPVVVRNTMDPSDEAESTTVSSDGKSGKGTPGADAASAIAASSLQSSSGAGAIGGPNASDFNAMPPLRAPSPSSSRILFTSSSSSSSTTSSTSMSSSSSSSSLSSLSISTTLRSPPSPSSSNSPLAVSSSSSSSRPSEVLAVARRKGVTLLTMVAYDMWGSSGFLSKVFAPFGEQGISVDLIATSQYAVSVTLDHIPDGVNGEPLRRAVSALGKYCTVEVRYPCAVVSIVGRSLRNALPQLGAAMRTLQGVPVHMLSEASEDLNLSFVVDEEHADTLVAALHAELLEDNIKRVGVDDVDGSSQFGPMWTELPCGGSK